MKKMYKKRFSIVKLSLLIAFVASFVFFSGRSYAQTYYSTFPNPTGHYAATNPTGCGAPAMQDVSNAADNDRSTYAFISDNIATQYNCTDKYELKLDLNLLSGLNAVQIGKKAGFRLKVSNSMNTDTLGKYLTVTTYLRDSLNPNNITLQDSATGGGSADTLYGIDVDFTGKLWLIYLTAKKPFNIVKLKIDPKIILVNTNFEMDVFFAFGGAIQEVLPAQIDNFKASVSGKNVNLSWQSLTETNVSTYRIERSSNGGASYSTISSVPAKGNSNVAINYGYTDAVSVNGNYLYRIVVVNNDGTSKATSSVAAIISGQSKLLIYPTVIKSGQNINIRTSENGNTSVYVYDAQGRLVKQQRTESAGQFAIPTAGMTTGVYIIKVVSATGAASQARVVIN